MSPPNETGMQTSRPPAPKRGGGGPPVVEIRNLIKHYGRVEALKGVTLTVHKGEIFGLLGQNGAGKTTMVKALLGIITPSYGEANLLGEPAGTARVRKHVGYLPEDHRFPDYHTAASLLDFYGALLEVPAAERRKRADEMLEFVGLAKRKDYKIRTYSKGMKQRLGIAQAIFHDPDVIFLDEPTDGVDPVGRRQIRELLLKLKEEGKTIFINSHLLGEVELISDRVVILHNGEIIREGATDELTRQKGLFLVGLAPGQAFPRDEVAKAGYAATRRGEYWEVALTDGQSIDPVLDLIRSRGLNLRHLEEKHQTLEDIFMETVEAVLPVEEAPRRRTR
ncbi:MAG TPA: ABC transporter ATP-binding protein [Gemmataceae bacterium]|nr:ABC transporter ATP-binding protein [Gemmataceae bacterium]